MSDGRQVGTLEQCFYTRIWRDRIGDDDLNHSLSEAMDELRHLDYDFQDQLYPNGYTSYHSKLHPETSPAMRPLVRRLLFSAERYLTAMGLDRSRALMLDLTDFFININGKNSSHARHRHEDSEISGVYYVAAPEGSAPICFTSPLEPLMMASRIDAFETTSPWTGIYHRHQPQAGELLLFPSWLLHEVSMQIAAVERRSFGINLSIRDAGEPARELGLVSRELAALDGPQQRLLSLIQYPDRRDPSLAKNP